MDMKIDTSFCVALQSNPIYNCFTVPNDKDGGVGCGFRDSSGNEHNYIKDILEGAISSLAYFRYTVMIAMLMLGMMTTVICHSPLQY